MGSNLPSRATGWHGPYPGHRTGSLADAAWKQFLAVPANAGARNIPYQHVPYPTAAEGHGGTAAQIAAAKKALLAKWNTAIQALRPTIQHPDIAGPFVPYGDNFTPADLVPIPLYDLPAGMPAWISGDDGWAAHRRHGDPQTPHDHYHRTGRHYSVKYIFTGRVVTMDADRKVLRSGAVYVDGKTIAAVAKADDPVLAGFETAPKVNAKGIILPGLIELHNHLSYNILQLWRQSPVSFTPSYDVHGSGRCVDAESFS